MCLVSCETSLKNMYSPSSKREKQSSLEARENARDGRHGNYELSNQ